MDTIFMYEGHCFKSAENVMRAITEANPKRRQKTLRRISATEVEVFPADSVFKVIVQKVGERSSEAWKWNTTLLQPSIDKARELIKQNEINSITIVGMDGRAHFYVKKDGNPASWIQ